MARKKNSKRSSTGFPTGRFIKVEKIKLAKNGTLQQVVIRDSEMPASLRKSISKNPKKRPFQVRRDYNNTWKIVRTGGGFVRDWKNSIRSKREAQQIARDENRADALMRKAYL